MQGSGRLSPTSATELPPPQQPWHSPPPIPHRRRRVKPSADGAGGGGVRVRRWCWCWVVLVRSRSPSAPTPSVGISQPRPLSPYVCKCMFQLFQMFQRHVAIVSYGCCKSRLGTLHMLQVFQRHVARLFKLFHLLPDVYCKRFDLDVAYVFTHMLQQYVPKCFNCFSLLLGAASVFMLQVVNVLFGC